MPKPTFLVVPKPTILVVCILSSAMQLSSAQAAATPHRHVDNSPLRHAPTDSSPQRASPEAARVASPGSPSILDTYIKTGLDSNLALHQHNFDLQRAELDLKRAQSLFFPQAGLSSQYTLANGGRNQSIPVGDLLNNVYSTLNQLTGSNKFPQVPNQSVQFLPNNFQDTKMEITLPILNTELQHNKEISSETINARRADRDIYRRDLVRDIRQAYYQYLQAGKAVEIYNIALNVVKENRRVSEKFVENHMATREIVLRAQAQVSQVEASCIEAGNQRRNAAAYFNFLLNRSLDSEVLTDSTLMKINPAAAEPSTAAGPSTANRTLPTAAFPSPPGSSTAATSQSVAAFQTPDLASQSNFSPGTHPAASPTSFPAENREEFNRLKSFQRITASNLKWDRNYLVPKLSAFYDIGFQGFGYHFNGSQFYQLAGIQLAWPLFKANDNKYKIRQARIDLAYIDEQYKQLTQQVSLEQATTVNNYNSSLEALHSLSDEVGSAREAYRLAERRFNEGQALQIELIDARTQMTNAEIRYSLGRLSVLNRAADLERVNASYRF